MVQDFRGFRAVYCATFWSGEQSFNSFALVVEAEKVSKVCMSCCRGHAEFRVRRFS